MEEKSAAEHESTGLSKPLVAGSCEAVPGKPRCTFLLSLFSFQGSAVAYRRWARWIHGLTWQNHSYVLYEAQNLQ